jgi:hypothetical protein
MDNTTLNILGSPLPCRSKVRVHVGLHGLESLFVAAVEFLHQDMSATPVDNREVETNTDLDSIH